VGTAGVGRDGEDDLHVDRRVAGDQVGEGLAAGLLDGCAGAGGDEVVGQAVDRGPGRGGVLAGERAVPLVDPWLGHPPAQPGRGPGSLRTLAHQVGGDPVEQHPGAAPQRCGLVAEVLRECGHDRVGHVGRCHLELERDDAGAVAVELSGRHGRVQPVEPAGLRHVPVVGRHRYPARGQPHGLLDPALGLVVRRPDQRGDDVGGIEADLAGPVHDLTERAVLAPHALAPSCLGDRAVLHRSEGVDQRLAVTDDRQPLVASPRGRFGERCGKPAGTDCHRPIGSTRHWAGGGGVGA
jgi:hypothetical protein